MKAIKLFLANLLKVFTTSTITITFIFDGVLKVNFFMNKNIDVLFYVIYDINFLHYCVLSFFFLFKVPN